MMDRFRKYRSGRIWIKGLDDLALIGVIKTLEYRPLDRDRTAEMLSGRLNLVRYNDLIKARAFDLFSGPLVHPIGACDAATFLQS